MCVLKIWRLLKNNFVKHVHFQETDPYAAVSPLEKQQQQKKNWPQQVPV